MAAQRFFTSPQAQKTYISAQGAPTCAMFHVKHKEAVPALRAGTASRSQGQASQPKLTDPLLFLELGINDVKDSVEVIDRGELNGHLALTGSQINFDVGIQLVC